MLAEHINWGKVKTLAWCQICADAFLLKQKVEVPEQDGRRVTYSFEPVDPPLPKELLGEPDFEMFEDVLETAKVGVSQKKLSGMNVDDLEIDLAMQVVNAYRFILEGRINPVIAGLNRLLVEK